MRVLKARGGAAIVAAALVVLWLVPPDEGVVGNRSAAATAGLDTEGAHHTSTEEISASGPSAPPGLAAQLAAARTVAARWPTAADAVADGWTLAEPYRSAVGAHYLRFAEVDGTFDVARPEMLLYGGDAPQSPIVGLSYYVLYSEPDGFAGPTDRWHQHLDVCIGPGGPLVGGDGVGVCATSLEAPVGTWAWMLHAWVVSGWASPNGVFSAENSLLR